MSDAENRGVARRCNTINRGVAVTFTGSESSKKNPSAIVLVVERRLFGVQSAPCAIARACITCETMI